jgi:hypothetical protein
MARAFQARVQNIIAALQQHDGKADTTSTVAVQTRPRLPNMQTDSSSVLLWVIAAVAAVAALVIYLIWHRGRQVPGEHVFRASRWSRGNHLFPTQVAVSPTSVVHYRPRLFGRLEQSIHIAHIASVLIETNLFFSNVLIESSGGAEPVRCHGHRKRDAVEMKRLIEQYQTGYYRDRPAQAPPAPPDAR